MKLANSGFTQTWSGKLASLKNRKNRQLESLGQVSGSQTQRFEDC